ncbi:MAG: TolC family protein [Planctomycetes bacterium]|nr:TolC family protein [Planctomycetota bacterium]
MKRRRGGLHAAALVLPLAASLLSTGCAVDGAADAQAWRDVVPVGADVPQVGARLDLVTSLRLANARNESLGIEGEAYARALIDRRRAAAAFLPTLRFSPSAFLSEAVGDSGRSGFDFPIEGAYSTNPAADEPETRRADATAGERRALLVAVQDGLLLDTARAHFAVLRAERRADVLRTSISVQDARVDEAKGRLDAGIARPLDVALSESRASTTRVDLVRAESAARVARSLLAFLTGLETVRVPLDGTLAVPPEPPPLDALLATARAARPEFVAAAHAESAAVAAAEAAAGKWWPTIAVDFTAFLARHSQPVDQDWRSFLEVRIPLFERGLIEVGVRDALSRLREARLRRERVDRLIRREVETARESIVANARRIEGLRTGEDAARRALDQAEGLWSAGLSTNLERLRAQDDLLAADLDLADAELERRVLHVELARALGTIHQIAGLSRPLATSAQSLDEPEAHRAETR